MSGTSEGAAHVQSKAVSRVRSTSERSLRSAAAISERGERAAEAADHFSGFGARACFYAGEATKPRAVSSPRVLSKVTGESARTRKKAPLSLQS